MPLRLKASLLFLPLPIAFYLLIAQPVYPLAAVIAGAALLVIHGFVSTPFIDAEHERRCIWSGRETAPGCGYRVTTSGTARTFYSCTDTFRERASRYFTLFHTFPRLLPLVIALPVVFFVLMEVIRLSGPTVTTAQTNFAVLQAGLGVIAWGIVIGQRFVTPIPHNKGPVNYPLPPSSVALIGIFWTLAIALVVGSYWIFTTVHTAIGHATL